jgi:hypothetical protein
MRNIVNELNALQKFLMTEIALRAATETEINQGAVNGPMRQAHDASIINVISAAQALVDKANGQ